MHPLSREFRFFGEMCAGQSPLYAELSPRVAEDPELLELASHAGRRRSPANMLFGAVHYLLLGGLDDPLADFYRSLGGGRGSAGAFHPFASFCRRHRDVLRGVISTRRVQTNEVGRSGLLMPAFATAWERFGRRPLSLIEVGCSTGLLLLFDRYHYGYQGEGSTEESSGVARALGPDSPVRIQVDLRGERPCPLPDRLPEVAGRVGTDLDPVDVTDGDACRWVQALIWPDQVRRFELLRSALTLARTDPPRVLEGDAVKWLPELVQAVSAEALPLIFHSHATYQMTEERRAELDQLVAELGRDRDLAQVSLEWLGDDPRPQLHLDLHLSGVSARFHLADCHHHGAWMRWLE